MKLCVLEVEKDHRNNDKCLFEKQLINLSLIYIDNKKFYES